LRHDFTSRATSKFEEARDRISTDIRSIIAQRAANGTLQSGATAKEAIKAFEAQSETSLEELLAEVSKLETARGAKWDRTFNAIEGALDDHIGLAPQVLEKPFRVAGAIGGTVAAASVQKLLAQSGDNLRNRLAAYRVGWTAPAPERWIERHPVVYAAALASAGAILGQLVELAINKF
jgi:hypothetical protein